jgi:hypothetical protein
VVLPAQRSSIRRGAGIAVTIVAIVMVLVLAGLFVERSGPFARPSAGSRAGAGSVAPPPTSNGSRSGGGPGGSGGKGSGGGGGSHGSNNSSGVPLGTAIAVGSWNEATSGSGSSQQWYYNATVETSAPNMTWSDLAFELVYMTGKNVTAVVDITAANGALTCYVAVYNYTHRNWSAPLADSCGGTVGGAGPIVAGAGILILSAINLNGEGVGVEMIGQGPYYGDTTSTLP